MPLFGICAIPLSQGLDSRLRGNDDEADGRRRWRRTGARALNVSFTALLSGKTSNTSGLITTTLAPCAYRAAVTPRIAEDKSYSARMVSRSPFRFLRLLFFFIVLPFPARRRLLGFANTQAELSPVFNILRFEPLGEARATSDFHLNILTRGD